MNREYQFPVGTRKPVGTLVPVLFTSDPSSQTGRTRPGIPAGYLGNRNRGPTSTDEGLWGTSVEERHTTKRRESVRSTVKRDLRGDQGVVERNDAADETGAVF